MTLWEKHGKDEGFTQETCPGFYQDVEALSKLVKLLPTAISRVSLKILSFCVYCGTLVTIVIACSFFFLFL